MWYSERVKSFGLFFFFFSSRRRHTRFDCDWSSDVCSSDLTLRRVVLPAPFGPKTARVWPAVRLKDTPSRATTCPRPSPKACRRPSAESIDAGGEVFQVERLDEIPRVAEVQHVDERLHAHVRGR